METRGHVNIDELIESGLYDLSLEEVLDVHEGEELEYTVKQGGIVQDDRSIPLVISIRAPERLAGREVRGKLVLSATAWASILSRGVKAQA